MNKLLKNQPIIKCYTEQYVKKLQQENKQLKEKYETLKQEHIDTINRNEEKQQRIDKTIDFIDNWEKYKKDDGSLEVSMLDLIYIKEILGGTDETI